MLMNRAFLIYMMRNLKWFQKPQKAVFLLSYHVVFGRFRTQKKTKQGSLPSFFTISQVILKLDFYL
jgi:hypothetical protein